MERLFNKIPSDRLYAATGIQFMQLNTIFQLFAQMERTPGHLARATSALMFPDLLHFWLSGKKVAEISIASTSQMVDPLKRVWSEEIMEELGLRADLFPRHRLRGCGSARSGYRRVGLHIEWNLEPCGSRIAASGDQRADDGAESDERGGDQGHDKAA
jgi:hypothetical protein